MSISKAERARLGLFLVAGAVVLGTFFSISLGLKLAQTAKTYYAFFEGESLSGLEQGATVKYTGVPIGKVDKISYQPDDLSKVKVILKVQSDFPIKTDMHATTGLIGITGLKYIEILGGTSEAPLLKSGSEIPTRVSMFGAISGKVEAIVAKVELLINNLNQLSNPDSLKSLRVMLDNVAAITGDARTMTADMTPKINAMTGSASQLVEKADRIAADVKKFTGTLDSAFSAGKIARTLGFVDSAAIALKVVAENMALLVRQSREDFTVTMQNLREATESANQLAKMLEENPSLLIKGEPQKERDLR
ncbi:MAG: MCE family protein [Chitinispirillaceae bacterium]|nr:MCE family protein [Chitinispirillaceae bacterium]